MHYQTRIKHSRNLKINVVLLPLQNPLLTYLLYKYLLFDILRL